MMASTIGLPAKVILEPALEGLEPGARLGPEGRYQIRHMLGEGGFGEAYLAHDTRLDRACVVKRLRPNPAWRPEELRIALDNFQREARLLVSLNTPGHPNIPEIYEYLPESRCLVMKYVVGENLGRLAQRRGGRLPEEEALRYTRDICAALVYMHGRSPAPAIHRDIKPANILLDSEGRVWLIDFGLSKALPGQTIDTSALVSIDRSQLAGTLGYTPPEQWRGRAEPRSDVYALAATLHSLLTGYQAPQSQLLAMIRGELELPPARELNPEVRPRVERLLARALAFDVAARPTARELLAELDALLSQPSIPPPEPATPPDPGEVVGRAAELAEYQQRLERDRLVAIVGLAGVGKTTLAAALARQVADTVFWHTFHPDEGGEGCVWALAAFLAHQGRDEAWRVLSAARLGGGQPPPVETLLDYLVALLRDQRDPENPRPLLCLDDMHQVADDPVARQLGERLAREAAAGHLMLIVTSRIPLSFVTRAVAPLGGLGASDARRFLESRGVALAGDLADRLVRYTGGNAQLLNLSSDALRHSHDPAALIARLAESGDIERYLLREVDAGLNDDERAVMSAVAALLGYGGTRDAIEALLEGGSARRALGDLCARSLLMVHEGADGKEYTQHAIIQAFFYEQLSRRERRALHHRAGAYYETEEPDRLRAARHYQRAGEHARAAALLTSDVWAAINQGQSHTLQALLEQLDLDRLEAAPAVEVCLARGEVAISLGANETARAHYQQALERLAAMPDSGAARAIEARICNGMGRALEYDSPGEALVWLRRGLERLGDAGPALAAELYIRIGNGLIRGGDYSAALDALDHGLALLPSGPSQLRVSALINLGQIHSARGDIARGLALTLQAQTIARQLGDSFLMLKILINLGIDRYVAGDWAGGIATFEEALELSGHLGSETQRAILELNLGTAYIRIDDTDAALLHLRNGVSLAREYNLRLCEVAVQASLADLHIRQHSWDAAALALARAEQLAGEIESREQLPEIHRGWARISLGRGEIDAALEQAWGAVSLAESLGADLEVGIGLRVLGQVLLAAGRRDEALERFACGLQLLDHQDPYEAAQVRAAWGAALLPEDAIQGRALLQAAEETFRSLGVLRERNPEP